MLCVTYDQVLWLVVGASLQEEEQAAEDQNQNPVNYATTG